MSFNIKLQTNFSDIRKVSKDITDILSLDGVLRDGTSIIDPVIVVEASLDSLKKCNYMTIDAFARKYFVTDIRSITDKLVQITGHVDVLSTYETGIRKNSAIIKKQEFDYNLYLNDGSLKIYQNPKVVTYEFPSGFSTQEFVLAVAGS